MLPSPNTWHAWPWKNPAPPKASHSGFQVWRWPIADPEGPPGQAERVEPLEIARTLLSEEEQQRADRFYFDKDRDRFLRARAGLKRLLAGGLGCEPFAIEFELGPHGKPKLCSSEKPLAFNLSHAGDHAIACITIDPQLPSVEVGIDIELRRPSQWSQGIAERYFTPSEANAIENANERQQIFFDVWTRKEAVLKLLGSGLQFSLSAFEVPTEPEVAGWVELPPNNPLAIPGCWLQSLPCDPQYAAAMATLGEPSQVDFANLLPTPR